jgi:transposase
LFVKQLIDTSPNQRYVLLDNISFHKSKVVVNALTAAGEEVIFTPPYCPDLNPIENMFSSLKGTFREYNLHVPREDVDNDDRLSPEETSVFIETWNDVSAKDWTRTFENCLKLEG